MVSVQDSYPPVGEHWFNAFSATKKAMVREKQLKSAKGRGFIWSIVEKL
jgi:hypothetical protein